MGGGLNPIPRWFAAALLPMMLLAVFIGLTLDPKASNVRAQESKDKKDVPAEKKETPKKLEIDPLKIVILQQKGNDVRIMIPKGLAYEAKESQWIKVKPKLEDGGEGWTLIRLDNGKTPLKACVTYEGGTKMTLTLAGVREKYLMIGLPEGYFSTYK